MNCCVCPALRLADAGLTLMLVNVWFTITFTLLVTLGLAGLTTVTSRLYVPAAPNVATVDWAAWLPLAEKLTLPSDPDIRVPRPSCSRCTSARSRRSGRCRRSPRR